MKLPRLGLRFKIFGGCLFLIFMILVLNYVYTDAVIRKGTKINAYMKSNYERYIAFEKALSDGEAAAVDIWATSLRLRTALDPAALADAEHMKRVGAQSREQLLRQVQDALTRVLNPSFIVIVDSQRQLAQAKSSPFSEADLHANGLINDVLQGQAKTDVILEHNHHAWLVNASPVHRAEDLTSPVVGAVIVGKSLEQIFTEYKRTTDIDPKNQIELGLINNQTVTASTFPAEESDEVAVGTQPQALQYTEEGGEKAPYATLPTPQGPQHYDVFEALTRGYSGSTQGTVGKLFVMRNKAQREQRSRDIAQSNLVLAAVALFIAGLVSWWLSVALTKPLHQFIAATRDLAHGQGDLTRRLEISSDSDEIIELADNLNKMFSNLHQLASEVQSASFQVGASSAEISAASKQMLGGASDQAAKIESSTAAVTELSSSIQQVAENAVQATKVARESGDRMQSGIGKLADTSAIIEDTASKISALGQSGKRIGNIVEVIRQISEQTSLLALNASIEAAHAGEQGRGFAVVADEVSSLARRVGQSAKDIEGLIATISEQTSEAVASMQNVTRAFAEYSQGASFMTSSLKQIVDVIQDTARSVQEQAVVSDEIARNMDAVQKIAHEVLSSSEEAVVQGEQLHSLALRLEQLVRNFRIEKEHAGHNGENGHATLGKPRETAALPSSSTERRKVARG